MTIETKSAFARRMGRSPSAVGQWIRNGLISASAIEGVGRAARINVELAQQQLAARRDPGQAVGNGSKALKLRGASKPGVTSKLDLDETEPSDDPDYAREKARLAKAQADAQEMKNAVARGELFDHLVVERRWADVFAAFKSRVLALPGRVRQRRPGLQPDDVSAIDAEARMVLTELARFRPV